MPYMDNDRDSTDVGDGWGVGSPLESGVSPAHIGPYHACHRAAPETTPSWTVFLRLGSSLSLSPPPSYAGTNPAQSLVFGEFAFPPVSLGPAGEQYSQVQVTSTHKYKYLGLGNTRTHTGWSGGSGHGPSYLLWACSATAWRDAHSRTRVRSSPRS